MPYTLAAAAKAVHRDKTTILRSIKAGKLSAVRDEASGAWLVEAAELHRVYPPVAADAADAAANAASRHGDAAEAIRQLEAERERERAQFMDQIADLRQRLDAEAAERRRLTALLTDSSRRRWWRFGR